jgi:hypothetical protein
MFLLPHVACKLRKKRKYAKFGCHEDGMLIGLPLLVVFWFLSYN